MYFEVTILKMMMQADRSAAHLRKYSIRNNTVRLKYRAALSTRDSFIL
jgi:hypothetical protein